MNDFQERIDDGWKELREAEKAWEKQMISAIELLMKISNGMHNAKSKEEFDAWKAMLKYVGRPR